ncbi:MAG: ATP-grasp domain-containing protein [Bacteroidales bacterium]|nr:ATP-grasp domain-containing protein [Bacteroidales bacterium]
MKKIAVIGASYLQLPLVKKAQEMGLEVHCFAWAEGAVCRDVADCFYPISIVEKEEILQVCRTIGIDGICTIASDVAAPTVAFVAENMGLVSNSYEAAKNANNKYLMRNLFASAGVPCPLYKMVKSAEEAESVDWTYPLIVKPSDRSGSLGVTKITSEDELAPAVEKALSLSFKKEAMVEEFIEGREISVEFISYRGVHYPLQITDKVTTEAPHFVELEHHQPAEFTAEESDRIYSLTKTALNALGLTDGASHSEYKITKEGRIVIMETGGRMGGDFIGSDLVRLSTGYDFLKGVVDVALGEFEAPEKTISMHSGVYFLCEETKKILPVIGNKEKYPEIVQAEITDPELRNVQCSADRSGYFIYQSSSKFKI